MSRALPGDFEIQRYRGAPVTYGDIYNFVLLNQKKGIPMSIWQEITKNGKRVVHPGPSRFVAGGQPVHCAQCQTEEFIDGLALLSSVGISFAHLDWATEKKVTTLMCDNCGLIQWFGIIPQRQHAAKTPIIALQAVTYDDELV